MLNQLVDKSLSIRRQLRKLSNARANMPVKVVDGETSPQVTGSSWHYKTSGGRRIYHPSAYAKKGWSNMVYCNSTIAVEVGIDWLIKNLKLA